MFSYSKGYYVSPPDDQYLKFKNRCSLLCSLAGRYDKQPGGPVRQLCFPTRFLAPIDCLKIPALTLITWKTWFLAEGRHSTLEYWSSMPCFDEWLWWLEYKRYIVAAAIVVARSWAANAMVDDTDRCFKLPPQYKSSPPPPPPAKLGRTPSRVRTLAFPPPFSLPFISEKDSGRRFYASFVFKSLIQLCIFMYVI